MMSAVSSGPAIEDEFQDNPTSIRRNGAAPNDSISSSVSSASDTATGSSQQPVRSTAAFSSLLDSALESEDRAFNDENESDSDSESDSDNVSVSSASSNNSSKSSSANSSTNSSNSNSDNSDNSNRAIGSASIDNDTKVAAQMAAVAALVTAATRENKIENSPSAAATYAKGLMAGTISATAPAPAHAPAHAPATGPTNSANAAPQTNAVATSGQQQISPLPPPPPPPPPKLSHHHHATHAHAHATAGTIVMGMKNMKTKQKIVPVHLNLVLKYVREEVDSLINDTTATTTTTDSHEDSDKDKESNSDNHCANKCTNMNTANKSENYMIGETQNITIVADETSPTNENENQMGEAVETIEDESQNLEKQEEKYCQDAIHQEDKKNDNDNGNAAEHGSQSKEQNVNKDDSNISSALTNTDSKKDNAQENKTNDYVTRIDKNKEKQQDDDAQTENTSSTAKKINSRMIMLQLLQNSENINLLKQLLILTHHKCIDIDQDHQSIDWNEKRKDNTPQDEKSIVNEQRAKRAALKAIELVRQIDDSFHFLFSCLPSSSSSPTSSKKEVKSNINLKPILNVEDIGIEDDDPNTSTDKHDENAQEDANDEAIHGDTLEEFEDGDEPIPSTHHIIPDLLPPCMPEKGDVTNSFFKACELVKPSSLSSLSDQNTAFVSSDATISTTTSSTTSGSTIASTPASATRNAAAIFFGGIGKGRRKKSKATTSSENDNQDASRKNENDGTSSSAINNESTPPQIGFNYNVVIESEMLGLTVENVLERTVVRTIIPQGAAKKAGTKVGSLIVKVGSVETSNLTHFETIDELRQSKRPLRLVLRKISKDALKGAREEMGRLIKGGGFGNSTVDTAGTTLRNRDQDVGANSTQIYSLDEDNFHNYMQTRWAEGSKTNSTSNGFSKKEETFSKVGAKLAWLLCLLIVGMEREAEIIKSRTLNNDGLDKNIQGFYSAEDYRDSAKSVSKVLHDYVHSHFAKGAKASGQDSNQSMNKKRSKQISLNHIHDRQRNAVPGASRRNPQQSIGNASSSSHTEMALLKIGDVLHRTRSFFADPNSPPAALLRGEVIALICDILDLDTEMALSDQEAASSTAGRSGGPIHDLGSAGSLLKLIVLNCSVIRSVGCDDNNNSFSSPHAGNRFLAVVHRLAASRSSSARVTACSLGPVLWGRLDFPHQLQLRGVITRALHDPDVIVRKSTATVLHEIAELVFDSRAVPWLVLMCERAMTDPEPQLKAAAMTLTWHLAEHLPNAFFGDARQGSRSRRRLPPRTDPAFAEVYLLQCKLLPVATRLAEDPKASVRLAVAAQCDRLANALGTHWHSVIIDLLQALLGDEDESVRAEAALCIPRLAEIVLLDNGNTSATVLESLLPLAIKLLKDPSLDVRAAVALAAGEMLTLLVGFQGSDEISASEESTLQRETETNSHKKHIDETLIPLLQKLLQDPDPEVSSSALRAITNTSRGNIRELSDRRNEDDSISLSSSHQSHIIEKKDPVFVPVLSEKQVLRLMPTLSKLAKSGQWRVRQSAVEIVPALLGCTQKLEIRSEIAQLCVTLMSDGVDAVRRTAAECLCLGGNSGGEGIINSHEWVKSVVMPHVEACRDSPKSKQRMLSLKMVEVILTRGLCLRGSKMIEHVMNSTDEESMVPSTLLVRKNLEILSSLSKDETVNVRLNVGRVLSNVICTLEESDLNFVVNMLDSQTQKEKMRPFGGDGDVLFFARRAKRLAQERLNIIK